MREPTALLGAINTALSATLGVLALTSTIDEELAGGLAVALGAWVAVGHVWLRSRVTPVEAPVLTPDQAAKVEIRP